MKRTGQISQLKSKGSKIPIIGAVAISRPSKNKLSIEYPVNATELVEVIVNGVSFYKKGTVKEVVRIAQSIYTLSHFTEVDNLIVTGMRPTNACVDVAVKYGFNSESFRQQYYNRHASKKIKVVKRSLQSV